MRVLPGENKGSWAAGMEEENGEEEADGEDEEEQVEEEALRGPGWGGEWEQEDREGNE